MSKELNSNTYNFGAVISIIENAKGRALKAVNANLFFTMKKKKKCSYMVFGRKNVGDKIKS